MTNEERRHAIKFFIQKFEAIPDGQWCVGYLTNPQNIRQHCAIGHTQGQSNDETDLLTTLFEPAVRVYDGYYLGWVKVTEINNGFDPGYLQPTPKARILAALRDKLAL